VIGQPEVWLSSEYEALPGQRVRLFGINPKPNPWRIYSHVYLRSAKSGKVVEGEAGAFWDQNWTNVDETEIDFLVPPGCEAGDYDVYVHPGFGGDFGFSEPFRLRVVSARTVAGAMARPDDPVPVPPLLVGGIKREGGPPPATGVRVVTLCRAARDGVTDDTAAIQGAIDDLQSGGGGVLHLAAGNYAICRTIHVKRGVVLSGAGRKATQISVFPARPMKGGMPKVEMTPSLDWQKGYAEDWWPFIKDMTPMVWLETQSGLQDLSLVSGPGADTAVFVACPEWHEFSKDIFLVRVDVESGQRIGNFGGWKPHPRGVLVGGGTVGFTMVGCDIHAGDPLVMYPTRPEHRYARIVGNQFRPFPAQSTNCVFLDAVSYSLIEDNEALGGARAWTFQRGFHHNWFFNNTIRDLGRRGNAEEMIMSEYGSAFWWGKCSAAEQSSVKPSGTPQWKDNQFSECSDPVFVFITSGRGVGQFRQVAGNDKDTVFVRQPWDVMPDATSCFAVLPLTFRDLYVNNSVIDCDGRVKLAWGSLVECVVAGTLAYHNEGLCTTSWINKQDDGSIDYTLCAHNLYARNRLMADAWITLNGTKSADYRGPGSTFSNVIRDNEVLSPRNYSLNQYWSIWASKDWDPERWTAIGVSGSHNIIEDNNLCDAPVGVTIREGGEDNVVRDNRIDRVKTPVLDRGKGTTVVAPSYQPYEATREG